MRRTDVIVGMLLMGLVGLSGCGSNNNTTYPGTPTTPSQTQVPAGATVVTIVGSAGAAAFSPNPVQAGAGAVIVWKNNDVTTHHIVLDDGSADFGLVAPGGVTSPLTLTTTNPIGFHCAIHPSMVGTINGTVDPTAVGSYRHDMSMPMR